MTPWFDRLLACTACGRTTYRPPRSAEGCGCGGSLSEPTAHGQLTMNVTEVTG